MNGKRTLFITSTGGTVTFVNIYVFPFTDEMDCKLAVRNIKGRSENGQPPSTSNQLLDQNNLYQNYLKQSTTKTKMLNPQPGRDKITSSNGCRVVEYGGRMN